MKHSYYILIATLFLSLGTAHSAERLTPEDRSRLVAWAQQQAAIPLNRDGSDQTIRFGLDTHIASASALPLTLREALMNAIQQGLGSFTVTIEGIRYSYDVTQLARALGPKKNHFVPSNPYDFQHRQMSRSLQNYSPQGFVPLMGQPAYPYGAMPSCQPVYYDQGFEPWMMQPGYPYGLMPEMPVNMIQHGYPYGQIPGYETVYYAQGFEPWMMQPMPGMNFGQPYSAAFNPYATSHYRQELQQMPPPRNAILLRNGSYIIPGRPAPRRPAHGNPRTMQANPSEQKAQAFVQSPSRQTTVQPLPKQQAEQGEKNDQGLQPSIVAALRSPIPGGLPSASPESPSSHVAEREETKQPKDTNPNEAFWALFDLKDFNAALEIARESNHKNGETLCLHALGERIPPENVPSLKQALRSKRNKIPLLEIVILYGPEKDREEAIQKLLWFDPKNTSALKARKTALVPEAQPDYEEINQQEPPATQPAPETAEQEAFEGALQFVQKPNASLPEKDQLAFCRLVVSSRFSTHEQKEAAGALIVAIISSQTLMHRGIRPENPTKSPEPADSSEPEVDLSTQQTDNPKKKKKKRKKKKPNPAPRHLAQQEQQAAAATHLVTTFIF